MNKLYYSIKRISLFCLILLNIGQSSYAQTINTLAGIGTSSFSGDGSYAIAAELAQPVSLARDGSGNVYISDQGNHRIRKISYSTGNISTVAGSSTFGFSGDGSTATSAQLYYPAGIAVDGSGNIYIADQTNQRIRKVTASTGIISTIAGNGTAGFSGDGGAATSANLNNPVGVAVDGSGNVYISDQYNQRIRKVTAATGNISTIAGTGSYSYTGDGAAATSATFQNPAGIKIDASGNIFIADLFNHVVRKITASTGNISTVAGTGTAGFSGDGSAATAANLNYPADIAIDDSGNIFIATQYSHRIRKVSVLTGNISTVAGTGSAGYGGDGGPATSAQINYPTGIITDGGSNLYIADRENHRVRIVCNYFTKPTVTTPLTYCQNASALALTATGSSLKWFTSPAGGTGTTTAPTPSTSAIGSTKYYVASVSSYGCEGPRDSITVNVTGLPSAPTATTSYSYCIGATASTLTATGTSLKWYTVATGGTGATTAPTPLTTAAGTTVYYVTQTSSITGCESPRTAITVIVNPLPSAPTVTSPVSYCEGATATALTATGTGLLWYTTATGGTGSGTAITPSTSTAGSTIYYVSQSNSCGESPRAGITVDVSTKPASPTVSTPVDYCQYAIAMALSATGTSLKWYTASTGGTGSTTAFTPSTTVSGSTTYYVSQTNTLGCESNRAAIVVNVSAAPAVPVVTTPVTYCLGVTASALTATGTGLKWYTVATGGTGSSTAPIPSTSSLGTTTYYVSHTAGGSCESNRTAIDVIIYPAASAPTVTSPVNLCESTTASPLTATGTSLKWYTVASGGTGSTTAITPSTATTGTTTYYVSQTSAAGCESSRASIVVNVNSSPAAPTVTTPVSYCQGASASALSASGTSLKWYTVASGGTGSTTAPTPSTSTTGSTNYYVTQSNTSGCESPRAAITVTINASPSAPSITTPVNYCIGATPSSLTATGTSLQWYTIASGGTGTTTAPTPSTASAGSTFYYVSQTVSGCEGPRAAIEVLVNPLPSAPGVTSPVDLCFGTTDSTLSATGTGLLWYTTATGGTGSSTAIKPSTSSLGSTTYYVSQTNGCGESARSAIVVNVNPVPTAPIPVSPVTYCQGDTAVAALSATGTNLKWYTSPTGGGSSTAPKPSTAVAGTDTFYVSQTNAYGCESPKAKIIVIIKAAPVAPVVTTPVEYCVGATASPLTATGTGLIWYTVPYGGTGGSTAPTPSTATAGTTTYYVSQTDTSSCPSLRAAIQVIISGPAPAPIVTTPVRYCKFGIPNILSASVFPLKTSDTLKWYTTATGGTPGLTAPVPSTSTSGTVIYYVSASPKSGCGEGSRSAISVIVDTVPAPPIVITPVNYCLADAAIPLTAVGTNINWYTSLTGIALSGAPTPYTTSVTSYKYYVTQKTDFGCLSPKDSITINVNPVPASPTVITPVMYCLGATATALSATGTSLRWYPNSFTASYSTTAPIPTTSSVGTTTYYVSQTNSFGCEAPRVPIEVIVNLGSAPPTATSPITYCQFASASPLTATGTSLLWYTSATGGTGLTTAPTPSTAIAGNDTFYVTQTISTGGCGESSRTPVVVAINPSIAKPTLADDTIYYCSGTTPASLSATGINLKWYLVSTGGFGSSTAPTPSTSSAGIFKYYVSQSTVLGCEGPRDSITVIVNPTPLAPAVTSTVSYCLGATGTLPLSATGTNLKWYTVPTGGTATTIAPTPSTAATGTTVYYVSQTTTEGCEGPRANISVVINPNPAAPSVVSPVSLCEGESATALSATGTSLKWYSAASGGIGSTTATIPSTITPGTTTYYVSQTSVEGCESSRSGIAVTVNPAPAAPLIPEDSFTYCQGAIAMTLSATGTGLKWYTTATGGTPSTTAPTPSTSTAGTITHYVCQTSAAGCEGVRMPIVVITNPTPSTPGIITPVEYCSGTTATALTATGTSLKWYTVPTGGSASTTAPTPGTSSTGAENYYVTQTSALGCESPRAAINVIVYASPSAPTVGFYVTLCLGSVASPLTAIGSGLKWYTVPTGGIGSTTAPTPSTTTSGITYYYVSQSSSSICEGPRATIMVNIDTLLPKPVVVSPVIYCQGETASALSASGTSHHWYLGSKTGSYTTTTPVPNTSVADTFIYYVGNVSSADCEGVLDSIIVFVNPVPAAPIVVTPVGYCIGATASPLTATGTSLLWYSAATGGTGSTTAPTPSTTASGTTIYYVSQSSAANCEGPRAAITVNVNPTPAAPTVTSPVVYCEGETAAALTATGTSLKWYTVPTGGTASTIAPTPSTVTAGTTTYYVSQSSASSCESPRSAITVTINPLPAAPGVTSPVTYCQAATASALTATGTSLKWYTVATGGTASTTAPTPSTATAGTTIYYVSQTTAANCEGPRAAITVNVNPLPAAPTVTSPVIYCQGATASALTATGTSLLWYSAATGGTGSTTAPTPSTTASGTTIYYVSQSSAANCEGPRAAITVNVNPAIAAPTVTSPVVYCEGETAAALTATGTSLKWYTVPTGGTASTIAPTPSTITAGTTTYYVSQSSASSCESPRSAITVTINPLPAAPGVTSPITYCQAATASALTATGTSLKWYTVATGGTASITAPTPSTATAGTTIYYVSQTTAANCEGPRAAITVNVNPLPAAPTVTSPVTYCQGATASALTATGTSLLWYSAATGGTGSTTAPTPSTTASGTTIYYVSQSSAANCEGPRAAITVNVNPTPAAPTVTSPVVYCEGETAAALTATGTSLKWYTVPTGGTASTIAPTPSTVTAGTTTYYVSQSSASSCESPRSAITVTINPLPAAPGVTSPVTYCQAATASALTATGTSLKWYTVATGGTASTTAPTPSTATAGTTIYYVSQTTAANCEGPRAAITVIINPSPIAPLVISPVGYCIGATAVPLTAVGTSLKWYSTASGGTGSGTAPTPVTSVAGVTTFYVSQSTTDGCESPRAAISVEITNKPDITIIPVGSPMFVYCKNDTVTLRATSSVTISSYQWYKNGTLLPGETSSEYKAYANGYYKAEIKNTYGCSNDATVFVFGDTLPDPTLSPIELQFCPNVNIILFCKPASSLYKYEWYKDGIVVGGATGSQLIINKAGDYVVSVTDSFGCATLTNHSFVSTYPAIPKPKIIRADPLLRLSLTYLHHQWYRNGKIIAGATGPSFTMSFGGKYWCEVSDANGCTEVSDTIDTENTSAIKSNQLVGSKLKIYPNPTQEKVWIEADITVDIRITDIAGKYITTIKNAKEVDMAAYADGVYIFTISNKDGELLGIEKINKLSGH
ncbi:MAG: T9SS type A sorting domain-containing protein [Chitinophagaceae bacterium]|jgi:sugar lactone lactonase YvrE